MWVGYGQSPAWWDGKGQEYELVQVFKKFPAGLCPIAVKMLRPRVLGFSSYEVLRPNLQRPIVYYEEFDALGRARLVV